MTFAKRSLAFVAAMAFAIGAQAAPPEVGAPAPDFSLAGSDGKTYKLSDFKGKSPVVIAWFPKAFTGGCTNECKSMRANSAALKATGAAYFTASTDAAKLNAEFAESLGLDYPVLSDPGQEVAKAYGVVHEGRKVPERWTFYVDKEGTIQAIDKKVNTMNAGADVVAKLKELKLAAE